MAIDTREKRASAIHVGLPWRGLLPLPDAAAEDQGDRQQVAALYRGILAAAFASLAPVRHTSAMALNAIRHTADSIVVTFTADLDGVTFTIERLPS